MHDDPIDSRRGVAQAGLRSRRPVGIVGHMDEPLLQTNLPGCSRRQGKVRDLYDLGDRLLMVSTDRISAFDWVLPTGIPDKGRILTQMSLFWFERLGAPHHVLSADVATMELPPGVDRAPLIGRTLLVRKGRILPFECVVRGYLAGSGWRDYQRTGAVCGVSLPTGLREAERLPEPIFTPATKAEAGHDENVSFAAMSEAIGAAAAEELRLRSLDLYRRGADLAAERGLLLADTKFEWAWTKDAEDVDPRTDLMLADEALTPDSSRYWPAAGWTPGAAPPSFDKQYVRDYLANSGWDRQSPPPPLPNEIVTRTRAKYIECYERVTGSTWSP